MSAGSLPGERRGGRVKGTPNKATIIKALAKKTYVDQDVTAETRWFEGNALAYLQRIYKDRHQPIAVRQDAAKAAIRYETPALQATTLLGDKDNPLQIVQQADTRVTITDKLALVLQSSGLTINLAVVNTIGQGEVARDLLTPREQLLALTSTEGE